MKKEKLLDLLSQMTLEEKIGQLVQTKGELFLNTENIITGPQDNLYYSVKDEIIMLGEYVKDYCVKYFN